jgi:hypothetical protein
MSFGDGGNGAGGGGDGLVGGVEVTGLSSSCSPRSYSNCAAGGREGCRSMPYQKRHGGTP